MVDYNEQKWKWIDGCVNISVAFVFGGVCVVHNWLRQYIWDLG